MLRKKLEAAIEAFSDERVRWLVGKSKELITSGVVDEETLDGIIRSFINDEVERHLILGELKKRAPLTDREIAESINLPEERVKDHLKTLRFSNEVSVVGEKENRPLYAISEVLTEERRRCPCEALVKVFLEGKEKTRG